MNIINWLSQNKRKATLLLFFIVIAIRLTGITRNDIALDEPFSIWLAKHSMEDIFLICMQGNNMPLYEWLMHFWLKFTGWENVFLLRLPSVVFSAGTVATWFFLSFRKTGLINSLAVAFLLTCCLPLQLYAHEFRCYSLFLFLCSLQTFFTLECLSEKLHRRYLVAGGILNILLAAAHYLAFFVLLVQALLLLYYKRKECIAIFSYLYLPLLFCVSPVLGNLIENVVSTGTGSWVPMLTPRVFTGSFLYYFNGWIPLALLLVSAGISILLRKEGNKEFSIFLLAYGLIPLAGLMIFSLKSPLITARYIGFCCIPLLAFLGCQLPVKKVYTAFSIIGCCWFLWGFNLSPWNTRSPAATVAKAREIKKNQEPVVVYPEYRDMEFAWHWDARGFNDPENIHEYMHRQGIYEVSNMYEMMAVVRDKSSFILCLCDVEGDVRKTEIYQELSTAYTLENAGFFPNTTYLMRAIAREHVWPGRTQNP